MAHGSTHVALSTEAESTTSTEAESTTSTEAASAAFFGLQAVEEAQRAIYDELRTSHTTPRASHDATKFFNRGIP